MKKLHIIYILFFGACFITSAQIQEENFNATSMPMGWIATSGPTGCTWESGYTGPIEGSGYNNPSSFASGGVIFNDFACGGSIANYVELEGPAIDLVAAGVSSVAIEITYNHQTFGNNGDFLVDVWDGSTWQNVLLVDGDSPFVDSGNNETTVIDVTAYINSSFKVKFIYDDQQDELNQFTFGVGIDDYKLLDTATAGIEDLESSGFGYYPNPVVSDELTLHSNENITTVNIFNVIGQKVIARKPVALESKIQMQYLPEGVYIIQVAIGAKEGSFKVIKQ